MAQMDKAFRFLLHFAMKHSKGLEVRILPGSLLLSNLILSKWRIVGWVEGVNQLNNAIRSSPLPEPPAVKET